MSDYEKPPVEVVIDMVKRYDRRIGLRMLYKKYNIPKQERDKYRELWSRFWDLLPDAFEKEPDDAVGDREAEKNDGSGLSPTVEAVQAEPEGAEDGQKETA